MKTRQYGFAATVITLGAIAMSTACGDQPKPKCVTGRGEFASRFTYVSGTADFCRTRKGELFGVQSYNLLGENGAPNLDKVPIAIQPVRATHLLELGDGDPNKDHKPYAKGIFKTSTPDDNDLCAVDMTSATELEIPAADPAPTEAFDWKKVKEGESAVDPDTTELTCRRLFRGAPIPAYSELGTAKISVKYEWSGVVFYVVGTATGTQFKGRLKYTENGEVCEWDVHALYPSVSCGEPVGKTADNLVLFDANPTCRATTKNDAACRSDSLSTELVYGQPLGSSINPDFPTSCEPYEDIDVHDSQPTQFVCLPPVGKFPALK
jgi:hypothetical protein